MEPCRVRQVVGLPSRRRGGYAASCRKRLTSELSAAASEDGSLKCFASPVGAGDGAGDDTPKSMGPRCAFVRNLATGEREKEGAGEDA